MEGLGAGLFRAMPVFVDEVLRRDVPFPFILAGEDIPASGEVEDADVGAGVLFLDVGFQAGSVLEGGVIAAGAGE